MVVALLFRCHDSPFAHRNRLIAPAEAGRAQRGSRVPLPLLVAIMQLDAEHLGVRVENAMPFPIKGWEEVWELG